MHLLGTITKNASVSIGLIQALAYLILRDEDKTQKGTVITGQGPALSVGSHIFLSVKGLQGPGSRCPLGMEAGGAGLKQSSASQFRSYYVI